MIKNDMINIINMFLSNNLLKFRRVYNATRIARLDKFRFSRSASHTRVDVPNGELVKLPCDNKWWNHTYMPMVVMVGAGVGTCIGSYHGYQESKKYTYGECIWSTVCFGWVGWAAGYFTTVFCPIAVPIVIVATIARQIEPVQEPEKKESDIYTLHDKRPT